MITDYGASSAAALIANCDSKNENSFLKKNIFEEKMQMLQHKLSLRNWVLCPKSKPLKKQIGNFHSHTNICVSVGSS